MHPWRKVESHDKHRVGHGSVYGATTLALLWRFGCDVYLGLWLRRDGTIPLGGETKCVVPSDVSRDGKDGVGWMIVSVEKVFHFGHRGIGNVAEMETDGRPTVRVLLVAESCKEMGNVAVGLVDVVEFEFFHHYFSLNLKRLRCERKGKHTVAFEPKGGLDILPWNDGVIVGEVVGGIGIVLTTSILERHIEVGNMNGASKHEVLEEMGKSRVVGRLIARAHFEERVETHHLGGSIEGMYEPQTVGKRMGVDFHRKKRISCKVNGKTRNKGNKFLRFFVIKKMQFARIGY